MPTDIAWPFRSWEKWPKIKRKTQFKVLIVSILLSIMTVLIAGNDVTTIVNSSSIIGFIFLTGIYFVFITYAIMLRGRKWPF